MGRVFLGVLLGASLAWFSATRVFISPAQYMNDCEAYAAGVYDAELLIAKIIATNNADEEIYKKQVGELCAYKGRLPKGLSTSTSPFPNIVWTTDTGWMMQTAEFPATFVPAL